MADTTISALSASSALAGTEVFPNVQGGTTKKATADQIGDRVVSRYALTKNNATGSDPTVNSDTTAGYAASSIWENTASGAMWICKDATASAALWIRFDIADHPGYRTGGVWYPTLVGQVGAGAAIPVMSARMYPFLLKERVTISDMGCRITATGAGNFQMAIYAMSLATKLPTGNVLSSTPNITGTATGPVNAGAALTGGNKQLEPGWYYGAIVADTPTGGTLTIQDMVNTGSGISYLLGSGTQADICNTGTTAGITLTTPITTFGTWPDMTSGAGQTFTMYTGNGWAHVQLKMA